MLLSGPTLPSNLQKGWHALGRGNSRQTLPSRDGALSGRGRSNADLLISNAREIPDHQAPIGAAGRQDGLVLGAPADLKHLFGVVVECVQGLAQIPQIMQRYLKVAVSPQSSAVPGKY